MKQVRKQDSYPTNAGWAGTCYNYVQHLRPFFNGNFRRSLNRNTNTLHAYLLDSRARE